MATIPLSNLLVDETEFFQFVFNSPKHVVVLSGIFEALHLYHDKLHTAVKTRDLGLQQDIALITRFLKKEASDRVFIRSECLFIDGFEQLYGDAALAALLKRQRAAITEAQVETSINQSMEQVFERAGISRAPDWGSEGSRADISQPLNLRDLRHEVFNLNREMHRAYYRGGKQESWRLKLRAEGAQKQLSRYAEIVEKSRALKVIRDVQGEEAWSRVLTWVKSNSRLKELEVLRDAINACKFDGRIYSRYGGGNKALGSLPETSNQERRPDVAKRTNQGTEMNLDAALLQIQELMSGTAPMTEKLNQIAGVMALAGYGVKEVE